MLKFIFMAYDRNVLLKMSLNVIREQSLTKICHVVSYLPCTKKTFQNHGLNRNREIKDLIAFNKVKAKAKCITIIKMKMRQNWLNGKDPKLHIRLYKLLANSNELARLSNKVFISQHQPTIQIQNK